MCIIIKYPKSIQKLPKPIRPVCDILWLTVRFGCTLTVLLVDIALAFIIPVFVNPVKLQFTQVVTLRYPHGEGIASRTITDKKEIAVLIRLCREMAVECFSRPDCECGAVQLIFEGDGKKVVLHPAYGPKDIMRFTGSENKFFYSMGKTNKKKLVKLLEGYGVTLP